MRSLQDKDVKTTAKRTYVKPAMEVYEMEIEGIIAGSATGEERDIEEWSKADVNGFESPIGTSINA